MIIETPKRYKKSTENREEMSLGEHLSISMVVFDHV